jgi:hypothetical protein
MGRSNEPSYKILPQERWTEPSLGMLLTKVSSLTLKFGIELCHFPRWVGH